MIHSELVSVHCEVGLHLLSAHECPVVRKDGAFPIELFWCPCQKPTDHKCLGLFLDFQFYFIDPHTQLYDPSTKVS